MAILQKTKIYKGFSTVGNSFGNFKLFDTDLITQDILNQFNVRKGERVMIPEFGTIVWGALFEPLTDELKFTLAKDIERIVNSEPRVRADRISVTEYQQGLQFEIDLTYLDYNIADRIDIKFDQSGQLILI
jgi:phage baseplate assembly protein W